MCQWRSSWRRPIGRGRVALELVVTIEYVFHYPHEAAYHKERGNILGFALVDVHEAYNHHRDWNEQQKAYDECAAERANQNQKQLSQQVEDAVRGLACLAHLAEKCLIRWRRRVRVDNFVVGRRRSARAALVGRNNARDVMVIRWGRGRAVFAIHIVAVARACVRCARVESTVRRHSMLLAGSQLRRGSEVCIVMMVMMMIMMARCGRLMAACVVGHGVWRPLVIGCVVHLYG